MGYTEPDRGLTAGDLRLDQRVRWAPRRVEGWSYGDTGTNEFVSAPGGPDELTGLQHEGYMEWSKQPQTGTVIARDADEVTIKLDCPAHLAPLEHDDTDTEPTYDLVTYQEDQHGDWEVL